MSKFAALMVIALSFSLGACASRSKPQEAPVADPWFRAARTGDIATLSGMIQGGKTIDEASRVGTTALMVAARAGHPTVVQWLLDHGANASKLDKDGQSALAYAVVGEGREMKLEQVVDKLIFAGADPFQLDGFGFQPIQAMVENNMESSIRKIRLTDKKPCDRVPKVSGQVSLSQAARRFGHESLASYFDSQGCW